MLKGSKGRKLFLSIFVSLTSLLLSAQQKATYWITFKDKSNSEYSILEPSKFLSQRAINRRLKNNVAITINDFPVSKSNVDSLSKTGIRILYTSRWFNAATIEVDDETIIPKIQKLSFVSSIEKTRDALNIKSDKQYSKNIFLESDEEIQVNQSEYGKGFTQINQLQGLYLHNKGYKGKSILLALIDGGFFKADEYLGLTKTWNAGRILATKDFVNIGGNGLNENRHGAIVLSTIASNLSDSLIGTAPEASFLLLRSEDSQTESLVECDNWIAAAEFADSAGVDIISSSLGYTTFDDSSFNFTYCNMTGEFARSSIAAEIASSKGIIVLASAGNNGDDLWHYIGSPADSKDILTIGAITSNREKASFSSYGPSADNRIKPDIMAMGKSVIAELSPGSFSSISGTSLSCPITAGLTACLLQAFPNATATAIRNAILQSASQFNNPDNAMGFGIPDFEKAFEILEESSTVYSKDYAFPNPFTSDVTIVNQCVNEPEITVECYTITGEKVFTVIKNGGYTKLNQEVKDLRNAVYFFRCIGKSETVCVKAVKL